MAIISTERQYYHSLKTLKDMESTLEEQKKQNPNFTDLGLLSMIRSISDEILEYEEIKKGNIPKYMYSLNNIGLLLIALRIKSGLSQSEFASKINAHQSQVARDEYNEYNGITVPRLHKLLSFFNIKELHLNIEEDV